MARTIGVFSAYFDEFTSKKIFHAQSKIGKLNINEKKSKLTELAFFSI